MTESNLSPSYQRFYDSCYDPTGTGMGGESIYGERFEDGFSPELYNICGALSMANADQIPMAVSLLLSKIVVFPIQLN